MENYNQNFDTERQGQPKIPFHPFFDPEGYKEKLAVRRAGNTIGLPLCLYFVGSLILQIILTLVLTAISGLYNTQLLLSDSNVLFVINAVMSLVLFTAPFVCVASASKYRPSELLVFNKVNKTRAAAVIMLGLGVCILSNIGTALLSNIINTVFNVQVSDNMPEFNSGWHSFLLMTLCIGIIPALVEEFAFRGIVLGVLRKHVSDGVAIVVSATFFGLVHGNFQQIPFAFGVGLVLGYATVYTGSMFPAIIIHAINNTMSVILSYTTATMSPMVMAAVFYLYYAVMLLFGLCGFILLTKTEIAPFRLSAERSENTKRNLKWICTTPTMIIYAFICVISAVAALFIM